MMALQERPFAASRPSDPLEGCVLQKIAEQAALQPQETAVFAGSRSLTRDALAKWSNRLAWQLRAGGVGTDVPVGLCLPRSLELVIGALGIMKAGGAYVPMDPGYPPDRLALMLEDTAAPVLVSTPDLARRLPCGAWTVMSVEAPPPDECCAEAPPIAVNGSDLAYIIYTSGSTGKPKGVEITHRGLASLVSWHVEAFAVTASDKASHVAGLGFDAAVWEMWPYLAAGASLHLCDDTTRTSAELLRDWLLAQGITIGFVPTPLTERLLRSEWPETTALRVLLTGGDTLRHYPPPGLPFVLVNNYGPTECTVVATSGIVRYEDGGGEMPSIGRPIANTQVYVLDGDRLPVRPGTVGEIYVGGDGVARGYHKRPELTAQMFVDDPFVPGSRLYRTGDLGRIRADGQIDFGGRIDEQIKIRGYRIEPNEIVMALNAHPDIHDSLIVTRDDAAVGSSLIAYLVLDPAATLTRSALRTFLRGALPEYMLPASFIRIETFPLTPNGKIDRAALPAPDETNTLTDDAPALPHTSIEGQVAEILSSLLRLKNIGRDDNFFLLGGHSLLGAQLIARLRTAFDVEIALQQLFEAPTVSGLAAEIGRLTGAHHSRRGAAHIPCDPPPQTEPLVSRGNVIELPPT